MKVKGQCHLCDEFAELEESHAWPKFAYKDYAADLSKGGQFLELGQGKLDNHQFTYHWFCRSCEERLGHSETYAAQLLRRFCHQPDSPVEYDERLLYFAVSISWRGVRAVQEQRGALPVGVTAACRKWKQFLRGDARRVEPFSNTLLLFTIQTSHDTECWAAMSSPNTISWSHR